MNTLTQSHESLPKIAPGQHRLKTIKAGQVLFLEGDSSEEMYILKKGRIKIIKQYGGKTTQIAELTPGSVLGEMSLLDGGLRSATALANEDCEVFVVEKHHLETALSQIPNWFSQMIKILIQRLRQSTKANHQKTLHRSLPSVLKGILLHCQSTSPLFNLENIHQKAFLLAKVQTAHCQSVCEYLLKIKCIQIEGSEPSGLPTYKPDVPLIMGIYRIQRDLYMKRVNPLNLLESTVWNNLRQILEKNLIQKTIPDLFLPALLSHLDIQESTPPDWAKILEKQAYSLGELLGLAQLKEREAEINEDINLVLSS